jgi:ubiquinone/menaquinone biosynthesis C-methylase UbiE
MTNLYRACRDVDAEADPQSLGGYLDDIASVGYVEEIKRRSLELLGAKAGDAVLDVGCGTGGEVRKLADIVGRSGRVAGLDRSAQLIAQARGRCAEIDQPRIEFVVGDAHQLPFADQTFDGCRADRTLQHLTKPDQALAEMARVVRSGGRVVVTEGGWELNAPTLDAELTNRILSAVLTTEDDRQWVGFLLPVLFKIAGLADVRAYRERHAIHAFDELARLWNLDRTLAQSVATGAVAPGDAEAWLQRLRRAVNDGEAWLELDMVHLAGVKP